MSLDTLFIHDVAVYVSTVFRDTVWQVAHHRCYQCVMADLREHSQMLYIYTTQHTSRPHRGWGTAMPELVPDNSIWVGLDYIQWFDVDFIDRRELRTTTINPGSTLKLTRVHGYWTFKPHIEPYSDGWVLHRFPLYITSNDISYFDMEHTMGRGNTYRIENNALQCDKVRTHIPHMHLRGANKQAHRIYWYTRHDGKVTCQRCVTILK